MPAQKKVQYTVEAIDIDGDNIPDGDLVTKYVNGKVVSRKFVPLKKLKKVVKEAQAQQQQQLQANNAPATPRTPGGSRIVYKNMPQVQDTNNPVMVADQTGFGQYIKAGAGLQAGSMATEAVVSGISSLFSSE
jgi:hypothetical protein